MAQVFGMAHRGYSAKYPENTMRAFEAAKDIGFTHLEIDVQLSNDGIPVVIHDFKVDRTTNGSGWVKDFTLDELRKLEIRGKGVESANFTGDRIPTLEEVLEFAAKEDLQMDIELKQAGRLYPGLEKIVLDQIRKHDMMNQVFISSFDHYALMRMREMSADIALAPLVEGVTPAIFPFIREIGATYLSTSYLYLTPEYIEICRDSGIRLEAWTVDDFEAMRSLAKYPDILICTNQCERWATFLHEHSKQQH